MEDKAETTVKQGSNPPASTDAQGDTPMPDAPDGQANSTAAQTPEKPKAKRGGSKPILKVSGIGKVENNMRSSQFIAPTQINQKNYYADYLKRDDQVLFNRQWAKKQKELKEKKEQELREKQAPTKADDDEDEDEEDEEEEVEEGSKVIVIHFGSRNLRVGLSTDVYPKSVPNVIAHRVDGDANGTAAESEEADGEASPFDPFSPEFEAANKTVYRDFRERMKFYKRRILPNSHDICVGFNSRTVPEQIPEHNDPYRVEWTDVTPQAEDGNGNKLYYTGQTALTIPPDSTPKYQLRWPIQYGVFNEDDYNSPQQVLGDISLILVDALERELQISFKSYNEYNVVFIIPDLFDKAYISSIIQLLFEMGFASVCIFQESMAATYGAGVSTACVVDVGAQKISIACVEEGMIVPDSRICLRYGGDDVTTALGKLLIRSSFPYKEIDLTRQYDWQLMDELKRNFATVNDADIAVQLYSFFQHSPGQPGMKYQFKTFDEVMLGPLGLFYPSLFETSRRLNARYSLFPQSFDVYEENKPSDALSDAQINVGLGLLASNGKSYVQSQTQAAQAQAAQVQAQTQAQSLITNGTHLSVANTPASSVTGTPAPEPAAQQPVKSAEVMQIQAYEDIDHTKVPDVGLDHAIIESITQASVKSLISTPQQTFYENLMIVGGGAQFPGFNNLLVDRLGMWREAAPVPPYPGAEKASGDISVMPPPREMDPQLITWKGGVVFSKLKISSEVWLSRSDWELFGSRGLQYKVHFII